MRGLLPFFLFIATREIIIFGALLIELFFKVHFLHVNFSLFLISAVFLQWNHVEWYVQILHTVANGNDSIEIIYLSWAILILSIMQKMHITFIQLAVFNCIVYVAGYD